MEIEVVFEVEVEKTQNLEHSRIVSTLGSPPIRISRNPHIKKSAHQEIRTSKPTTSTKSPQLTSLWQSGYDKKHLHDHP